MQDFHAPVHLAIGIFDAVHCGHRKVIDEAIKAAKEEQGVAWVLTFDPHPSRIFRPEAPALLIMAPDVRVRRLCDMGADAVVMHTFDKAFASLEAEAFLPMLKRCIPSLSALYVGENWLFGKGRRGDLSFLQKECQREGIRLRGIPACKIDGIPVSSTRIRACLELGAIEEANRLLGYKYFSEGIIQKGKQLGRTLGFPTLNLHWMPEKTPHFGVYAVQLRSRTGAFIKAVANYGVRPTVEDSRVPILEMHALEKLSLGYGDWLHVEWEHFIRPEKRFKDIETLKKQLGDDIVTARAWFSGAARL